MGAEVELYVLAYAAIRFQGEHINIGRGVTYAVCASRDAALGVAFQAAKNGLPGADGWIYHDVVVTALPQIIQGGGFRVRVIIEEIGP